MPEGHAGKTLKRQGVPRVLLVEDDLSIRQFVFVVLEDSGVDLVECPTLSAARQALREAADSVALVLLDLMLPDGSGIELLQDPLRHGSCANARWVVFSASISVQTLSTLETLKVDQILDKPVSVMPLLECVEAACTAWRCQTRSLSGPSPGFSSQSRWEPGAPEMGMADGSAAAKALAVESYFFGQTELFLAMESSALERIPNDIREAEDALTRRDARQLQRSAHNLKSVLRMMGRPRACERAQALELAASGCDEHRPAEGSPDAFARLEAMWRTLKAELENWLVR